MIFLSEYIEWIRWWHLRRGRLRDFENISRNASSKLQAAGAIGTTIERRLLLLHSAAEGRQKLKLLAQLNKRWRHRPDRTITVQHLLCNVRRIHYL
jgi:hypothetical protein